MDAVLEGTLMAALTPTEFTILANAQGTFAGLPEGATILAAAGQHARITYTGGQGHDVVLTVS